MTQALLPASYKDSINQWGAEVIDALVRIFPTELEVNTFRNPPVGGMRAVSGHYEWGSLRLRLVDLLTGLDRINSEHLNRYTDLPIQSRLYIEDIDSFKKARDVNPAAVTHLLRTDGYLDVPEDQVQMALEQVLDVVFHKRDWGGETNDLYTANVVVNGARTATAFLLKGNGLRKAMMEIRDLGKNGDQLVRLIQSPAQLFVVQFVGTVSESVIADLDGKVAELRSRGRPAWYCVMNGQDTARVLHAYGKL